MNDDTNEILLRIEQLMVGLLRAAVSEKLGQIRSNKTLHQIYEMTGGSSTVGEIASRAKVSTGKVSGLWQSWEDSGLIVKVGKSYKKLIP